MIYPHFVGTDTVRGLCVACTMNARIPYVIREYIARSMQVEGTATSIKTTPCADALITHGARAHVPTTVLLPMLAENAVDAADLNTPCGEHARKVECAPRF
jgi:hypothetical protein